MFSDGLPWICEDLRLPEFTHMLALNRLGRMLKTDKSDLERLAVNGDQGTNLCQVKRGTRWEGHVLVDDM